MEQKLTSETFSKDENGVIYKHPERSCKQCTKYPCFKGQNLEKFCDYAKYGCVKYINKGDK